MHTQHDVHPGRKPGLGQKSLVSTVLAAAIGDLAVNDGDLAVVAQVNAAGQQHAYRVAQGQGHSHFHASGLHGFPQWRVHQCTRAQTINHGTALHPALGGANQRLGNVAAGFVVQPDVVEHMNFVLRRIHILQHAGTGRSAIGHQFGAVALAGQKAVDGRRIAKGAVPGAVNRVQHLLLHRLCIRHGGLHVAQHVVAHFPVASTPTTAQGDLTKQKVQHTADDRQQHHGDEPAHANIGAQIGTPENAQTQPDDYKQMQDQKNPCHGAAAYRAAGGFLHCM